MSTPEEKSNDPLYDWKKHSGFKKGLATDIVFGDERKKWMSNSSERFASTMHTDFFSLNQNKTVDDGSIAALLEESAATVAPRKNVTSIRFGDLSTENASRFESVTTANYKAPPSNAFHPHEKFESQKQKNNSSIEKHHTKPETATSAAHVGLQTRQDLPIDDTHFKCFVTSHADAYSYPRNIQETKNYKPSFGSNIHQGDPSHYQNYSTMSTNSYVHHPREAYQVTFRAPSSSTAIVLGDTRPHPSFLNSSQSDDRANQEQDRFMTTSSLTYTGGNTKQSLATPNKAPPVGHGKSYIVFGEYNKGLAECPSVTQRDYHPHDLKQVFDQKQEYENQLHQRPYISAIGSALAPGRSGFQEALSCTSSTYRYPNTRQKQREAAGIEYGAREQPSHISSIPYGDPQRFPAHVNQTTTGSDFSSFPYPWKVEHPILGAKSTQSTVRIGEVGGSMDVNPEDRYRTTTNDAFVPHSEKEAAQGRGVSVKPRVTLHTGGESDISEDFYSMAHNTTTHSDHYKSHGPVSKIEAFHAKPCVQRKMLFPLRSSNAFGTETGDAYELRQGLFLSSHEAQEKKQEDKVVKQLRTKSSIAFGDPHLHYY